MPVFSKMTGVRKLSAGLVTLIKSVDRFGLINQHDRNVVPDFVPQFTVVTYQSVFRIVKVNVAFALRAGQNIEQLPTDSHGILLKSFLIIVNNFREPYLPRLYQINNILAKQIPGWVFETVSGQEFIYQAGCLRFAAFPSVISRQIFS
jgi:hypothetical protein